MTIPESELGSWAAIPDASNASRTYEQIEAALSQSTRLASRAVEIYLQGSYANHTNVRVDSDVDIVAELQSTFQHNVTTLPAHQQRAFHQTYSNATYLWEDFRNDVLAALRDAFGYSRVDEGNKCISVDASGQSLRADVLACLQYRDLTHFENPSNQGFYDGVAFYDHRDPGRRIVNYPKEHRRNGEAKNQRVGQRYKPAVRMFKNARRYLVRNGRLPKGLAPSYFLECWIYNAADHAFGTSLQITYLEVLDWLGKADLEQCLCGNERTPLFGSDETQWDIQAAAQTWRELVALWSNWV